MDWINAVQTVAFPILACVAMAYYIYNVLEKMRTSVDACTKALILLAQRLGGSDIVRGIESKDSTSE